MLHHPMYQMTAEETQFYQNTDRQRFHELLNMGLEFPAKLQVRFQDIHFLPLDHDESGQYAVVAYGISQESGALFGHDWIRDRVRCVISAIRSESAFSQMLPSKVISQIVHLHTTSQFPPLVQLLRKLQKNVKADPKEHQRFEEMIRECECRQQASDDEEEDYFDEEDFKAMVYRPNHILPFEKLRLSASVRASVQWFCQKYRHRKRLMDAGLPWGNRILLAGPPGNGKTALAGALSRLLDLPIFIVNMGELRRSHIGETGHNMDTLFHGLKRSSLIQDGKAIIFFDECDSVATTRIYEQGADKGDSASLNVLLTNLDQMDSETVVIAATNYPDELDPAFRRRFSASLWLAPPTAEEIHSFVADYQREHKIVFTQKERGQIRSLYGKPWAKVTEFCQSVHTARIIGSSLAPRHTGWSGKEVEKKCAIGFKADR